MKGSNNMKQYKLTTYSGYAGEWYCAITYPRALGNTYEAEAIKYRSLDAARRAIRRAIVERNAQPAKRLRYKVFDNDLDSLNRLHGLVITEA